MSRSWTRRIGDIGKCGLPRGDGLTPAGIGIEEISPRAKHAHDFRKEASEVKVLMRSFDIDNRVKGLIGEGKVFGVPLDELKAG